MFCHDCITSSLTRSNNCPYCRENYFDSKVPRKISNLLNNVLIICPNNCRTKIAYCDLQEHLLRCQFTYLKIKCNLCQTEVLDTINFNKCRSHTTQCGDFMINCDEVGCKALFKRKMKIVSSDNEM